LLAHSGNWVHKTKTNKQKEKNNVKVTMLSATFNNILAISWRSVLVMEGTGCATRKLSASGKSPVRVWQDKGFGWMKVSVE
jgi:hypothetical protein